MSGLIPAKIPSGVFLPTSAVAGVSAPGAPPPPSGLFLQQVLSLIEKEIRHQLCSYERESEVKKQIIRTML